MKIPKQEIHNICKAHSEGVSSGMLRDEPNPYTDKSPLYIAWNIGYSEGWQIRSEQIKRIEGRQ